MTLSNLHSDVFMSCGKWMEVEMREKQKKNLIALNLGEPIS
jgi:hypothetical protein